MLLDLRHVFYGNRAIKAARTPESENPFLKGNFAPVRKERTDDNLKVVGTLPADLDGLYVRNGPNPQFDPVGPHHWFEGDGMLHGVRLQDGAASYRNRFIRTAGWKAERAAGKPRFKSILQRPDLWAVLRGRSPFKNAGNTALVRHAGKCLALYEAGLPHEIGLPDLETAGECDFAGKLRGPLTAHPKVDPVTGEMLGFSYGISARAIYHRFDAAGVLQESVPIVLERPAMMHDFAITANYAIFFDLPQNFDLKRAFMGKSPWYFDESRPARFGLLPRRPDADGKRVPRWFEAQTCYMFHSLNAYEEGDSVVLVGCRYPRFPVSLDLAAGAGKPLAKAPPVLYRWTMDLKTGRVAEGIVDDFPSEMPRIAESRVGRPNRYGYTASGGGEFATEIRKHDFRTGKAESHALGEGRFAGEATFVPRADSEAEDDGYLLTYVYDRAADRSELLVVDAADVAGKPLARVLLPARVPYGFHGIWVAGRDL